MSFLADSMAMPPRYQMLIEGYLDATGVQDVYFEAAGRGAGHCWICEQERSGRNSFLTRASLFIRAT